MTPDIFIPINALASFSVAWLYGTNIQYEGDLRIRALVVIQTITALIFGMIYAADVLGIAPVASNAIYARPAFALHMASLSSLAFLIRHSRRR